MKSPTEYLNLAKEKLRKEFNFHVEYVIGFDKENKLCDSDGAFEWFYSKLQLQQEDAEKTETILIKNRHEAEILLNKEIEQLKAELSQAREEKTKAFDEGYRATLKAFSTDYQLVINPYKQDTQPKDK